jgi:hypothetical protein
MTAKVLRLVAFGVLVTVVLSGGLFAAASVVTDMPVRVSVLAIGLWLAVAGGFSWWAVSSPTGRSRSSSSRWCRRRC